ncbi:MAG: hypothetical protein ACRD5K_03625 [Candidatus Acidiferrales bacterium]
MSKLVNWGHWLVGVPFAVWGTLDLLILAFEVTGRYTPGYVGASFDPVVHMFLAPIALLCAWGIWTWRRWCQYLALFLCISAVVAFSLGIYFTRGTEFNTVLVLAELVSVSLTSWLLLPSVRAEYRRRSVAI